MQATKICPRCKNSYPATREYFHVQRKHKDGLRSHCKQCCNHYQKQYQKNHYQQYKSEQRKSKKKYYGTTRGHLNAVWKSMFRRCHNPKDKDYKYYGGRGIKVKFVSFNEFFDYVVNELKVNPKGLTIDRINNDKHYERGNIRFVSQAVNNQNKRAKAKKEG